MGITDVLALLGGLALFLYGMQMMSTGLEAAAGNRMKSILEKLTSNRVKGVLVGAAITAVIQSSSATTVMVVGFVNSGLMTLKQAVWVIMGANIGTTITGQLIALDIGAIAPLFAIAGVGAIMFIKSEKVHHISSIFAGLGILFMGMDMMGAAMSPLKESEAFISLMTKFDNPLLGILVGALFTAVICIGRYFAGACVYRYDPALKRGVRFVRTKHRNMYHGSFGIDRNEGKCKAYDGYPSVI
jgi:phosphate:Na+ symporter